MDDSFPLVYQIICIVLTALFVWAFVISREPRQWRRLYQAKFGRAEDFSVNRNKAIDEDLKKYGMLFAMFFLVLDVGFFLWGASYQARHQNENISQGERLKLEELERIHSQTGGVRRNP